MINVAQVVAAVALGSLLTIVTTFVFKLYAWSKTEAEPDEQLPVDEETDDERERLIETAAQIAADGFDLLTRQTTADDRSPGWPASEIAETFCLTGGHVPRQQPSGSTATATHGAVTVRRKRHLRMLIFSGAVGLLVPIGAVDATAAASTATTMPPLINNLGAPPAPAPIAWWVPQHACRALKPSGSP